MKNFIKLSSLLINAILVILLFLTLIYSYLNGAISSYNGDFGELIPELENVICVCEFKHTNIGKHEENTLKEKDLLLIILKQIKIKNSVLNNFLSKYSLSSVDFMILAKTSINYKIFHGINFKRSDLLDELVDILKCHDL